MRELKITECGSQSENIDYVKRAINSSVNDLGGKIETSYGKIRAVLTVKIDDLYVDYLKSQVEDRIADVISVKYKYAYFKRNVTTGGIGEFEKDLLRIALIAADIDEDKRYVIRRIREYDEYALDGIYNFRLLALRRKWQEVSGYIPSVFKREQLKEFIAYLLNEKRNKRVFVDGGKVYDADYNRLDKTALAGGDGDGRIIREILLSASGSVGVKSRIPELDEKYIRMFYDKHAVFDY